MNDSKLSPSTPSKLSLYSSALHPRTSAFCRLVRYDASRDAYFCDFGGRSNPFTWVPRAELSNFVL